ncbi:unnamed protein product [Rhodiola kirilowii]
MAEIALVAAVIPKLITLLDGEVQLHRNIRSGLESIKRELECIKDFLIAADASEEECWEDDVWVSQVREVAFELRISSMSSCFIFPEIISMDHHAVSVSFP